MRFREVTLIILILKLFNFGLSYLLHTVHHLSLIGTLKVTLASQIIYLLFTKDFFTGQIIAPAAIELKSEVEIMGRIIF